jgi:pheromone shutdown-related protein TraB
MSGNSLTVNLGNKEIKLIGTAHVSRESIEEVQKIITEEKPDMVCVELDQGRFNAITQSDNWEKLDLAKVFKEGKGFLLIANLVLSGFQRRLGNELGVKPGEEMKVAVEAAQSMGIQYSLCDREVHTTLRRAWAKCGLFSKVKLLASLLASAFTTEKLSEEEIENLKNKNELDGMMDELAQYLPAVKAVLIDERDFYLAAKIWESVPKAAEPKKVVAVVGAGHMQGIKSHLEKLESGEKTSDVSKFDVIPPKTVFSKAAGFIVPVLLAAIIVAGFFTVGAREGLAMLMQWVLWNSSLAAAGAILAFAHPLAVLASFVCAPLGTMNPFIGVGMFSGLVQVAFRKPQVSDVEKLTEEAVSLKGIYHNKITRALLVFFLSTLGGAAGNLIAGTKLGVELVGRIFAG